LQGPAGAAAVRIGTTEALIATADRARSMQSATALQSASRGFAAEEASPLEAERRWSHRMRACI
jgi:hypothetical protein